MNTTELTEREQKIIQWSVFGLFIILFAVLFYLRFNHIIPGPAKVIDFLQGLYKSYGYIVVFIAALIEGLIIINAYAPGSTAILLGVIFAKQSGLSVPLVIALAIVGFLISYCINYALGRYALESFLKKIGYEKQVGGLARTIKRKGYWVIVSSYFHPNMAALVATAAGVARMPFRQFLLSSIVALVVWDSLWGIATYQLGESALRLSESPWIYPVVLVWIGLSFFFLQRAAKQP
jgi:membrane protein DedA with SNARE-associated domain